MNAFLPPRNPLPQWSWQASANVAKPSTTRSLLSVAPQQSASESPGVVPGECISSDVKFLAIVNHMTRVARKLKTTAPELPVSFIAGSRSAEVKQVGWRYTRWLVPQERTRLVEGTHLFPLERPVETAQAITQLAASIDQRSIARQKP